MDAAQFAYEFDVVYESIASDNAPGYEVHEKSIILSRAQEEILNDILEEGVEANEFNRLAVSPIFKKVSVTSGNISSNSHYTNGYIVDLNSSDSITLGNIRFILNERANSDIDITPISYNFYKANKDNPYKNPDSDEFWRLILEGTSRAEVVIITDGTTLSSYKMEYIEKLTPIIVPGVTISTIIDDVTVDATYNSNGLTSCLHHSVHRKIITKAAQNADIYIKDQLGVQLREFEN